MSFRYGNYDRFGSYTKGTGKTYKDSHWVCRGKGSCGFEHNWWSRDKCFRCNKWWEGFQLSPSESPSKQQSAEVWGTHSAVAAVAAAAAAKGSGSGVGGLQICPSSSTTGHPQQQQQQPPAAQHHDVKPAVVEVDDTDDIDGMESCLVALKTMGVFGSDSPVVLGLQQKLEESKRKRAEARPHWAQDRDLRARLGRKQKLLEGLRVKAQAAKDQSKEWALEAENLLQKSSEVQAELASIEQQLASLATQILRETPGAESRLGRLPSEVQRLPQDVLQKPEWQAKLQETEKLLNELVGAARVEEQALEARRKAEESAKAEAAKAQAGSEQPAATPEAPGPGRTTPGAGEAGASSGQPGAPSQASGADAEGDLEMDEVDEAAVLASYGDLLPPGTADGGDDTRRREATTRLFELAKGKVRKATGKKKQVRQSG